LRRSPFTCNRHSAHRALDLHPIVSHFFRFWLWATTGMTPQAWTAIHRKHHAKCETVKTRTARRFSAFANCCCKARNCIASKVRTTETLEHYGPGTPDDWLGNHVYGVHETDSVSARCWYWIPSLFGPIGITIWAVQMMWIPFPGCRRDQWHRPLVGYRNFQSEDASNQTSCRGASCSAAKNCTINHHAYATSAKLSNRWYEFDIGWMYIRSLKYWVWPR
jgi:stearoyl-CoA desaturase (delta-9 desaturase)